jgi:hypothetical protein
LEDSLALTKYRVVKNSADGSFLPQLHDLNDTCKLEDPRGRTDTYTVSLPDVEPRVETEIRVAGGEDLQLYRVEDSRGIPRLIHRRYRNELLDSCDKIVSSEDPRNQFFIGAHMPDRDRTFRLSLQNADPTRFSPRPAEGWIEIRPLVPTGQVNAAVTYYFSDLQFEPDRPVPVIVCPATGWPPDAAKAEIRAWFRLQKVRSDASFSVRQARLTPQRPAALPNAEYSASIKPASSASNPLQVVVEERSLLRGESLPVKIELQPPAEELRPPPIRVVHRYNAKAGTVRHTFYFGSDVLPTDVDEYVIRVVRRESITNGAITPREPLHVTMPRN